MQIQTVNPDDEIRIGLLCPAQQWLGLCRQMSCARAATGLCSLDGRPHAAFCKIPVSHPVSQIQRALMAQIAQTPDPHRLN